MLHLPQGHGALAKATLLLGDGESRSLRALHKQSMEFLQKPSLITAQSQEKHARICKIDKTLHQTLMVLLIAGRLAARRGALGASSLANLFSSLDALFSLGTTCDFLAVAFVRAMLENVS